MPNVYVTLAKGGQVSRSVEHGAYMVDYDADGNPTGIEILDALAIDVDVLTPARLTLVGPELDADLIDNTGQRGTSTPVM